MKILIVGGGTGGTIIANNLARRLSKEILDEKVGITLLSASDKHMYQPGLLYVAFGQMTPDELYRDEASLLQASIEFHVDPVKQFNTDDNHVITESGKRYDYDYLVIATGSRIVPEQVPGLKEGADTFYTEESALKLFHKLRDFEGGDISIVVGVPHKCPIAPVEFTFSLHEYLQSRGIRDKTNIWNTEVIEALELENLLLQSLVSIESALNRKESRGAHSRVDYKKRNDKSWLKHTMAWVNNNKKPKIRYRPVNLKTNSKEIKTIEPKVRVY